MYVCMYMLPLSLQPLLRFYSSLCLENPPPDGITGGGSTEKKYTDENQGPSRHSPNIIHIHITKWVFRSLICQWDLSRWQIAECSGQAYVRIWRNRSLHFPLYVFFLHGYNSLKWPACEVMAVYLMGSFFLRPLAQREVRQGERKLAAAF